jgi:anti-sigma factor RsiW
MMSDEVTGLELEAYLDGELDGERRLAVEDHLARNPAEAAQVMTDMSLRTALQLAQPDLVDDPALLRAAARLDDTLARRGARFWSRARWIPVAATLVAITMVGLVRTHEPDAPPRPPTYVADAVESFQTGLLRATMASQVETPLFDAGDVQRYTRIRVPALPAGWRITDVQIFPSDDGPALQIMIRTTSRRTISMFAVRSDAAAPTEPVTVKRGKAAVAYWRTGDIAYALTGIDSPTALGMAARDLADNRIG